MKRFAILLLVIFLFGCAPKVVRIDNPIDYQQQAPPLAVPEQQVKQTTTTTQNPIETTASTNTETTTKSTSSSTKSTSTSSSDKTTTNTVSNNSIQTFNASNEFNIISCCNEGIVEAETKQQKTTYTVEQAKEIIIAIQNSKCNELSSLTRYRINLKFKNELQDDVYLKYVKTPLFKEIKVFGNVVSEEFNVCN